MAQAPSADEVMRQAQENLARTAPIGMGHGPEHHLAPRDAPHRGNDHDADDRRPRQRRPANPNQDIVNQVRRIERQTAMF